MNVVFGAVGPCSEEAMARGRRFAVRNGAPPSSHEQPPHERSLLSLGSAEHVIGRASRDGIDLVLLGHLHLPLEGWRGGHPLDSADRSAEYLLDRYLSAGLSFADGVYGQFTVALNDPRNDRIVLVSDPYGIRWFFYTTEGPFRFSTSLGQLAAMIGGSLRADRTHEDCLLIHGFHPFGATPYDNVRRLDAGRLLVVEAGKTRYEPVRYDDPWRDSDVGRGLDGSSEEDIVDALEQTFMRAVEEQLASAKRVAVLLGGFDSALVASALVRLGKEVETFSFFYDDARFNQPHTDTVAKHLGIRHNWVHITPGIVSDGLRRYDDVYNQPTCWPNYVIQTKHVAECIRNAGFDVCYSGDGCDAIFFGYPLTFKRLEIVQAFDRLPEWLVGGAISILDRDVVERLLGRPHTVLLGLLRGRSLDEAQRQLLSLRVFDPGTLERFRLDAPPVQESSIGEIAARLAAAHRDDHPIRRAYAGKNLVSPTKIKLNASLESAGLHIDAPFLHAGLKRFVQRLPAAWIRPDQPKGHRGSEVIGKYILTRMAETKRFLPPEVIHQRKVGAVDAPVAEWYAGPLRGVIMELVEGLPFRFRRDIVERMLEPRAVEAAYVRVLARSTNNVTTVALAPSLLATLGAFTRRASMR